MTIGPRLSERLAQVVDALPLRPGMRVLEIGGASGAAARAVARRLGDGHILVVDRSAKGTTLIERHAAAEIAAGLMSVRHVAVEDFRRLPGEPPFDLAFAIRVGALDGRHPEARMCARQRIGAALAPAGELFVDGGDPPASGRSAGHPRRPRSALVSSARSARTELPEVSRARTGASAPIFVRPIEGAGRSGPLVRARR